MSTIKPEPPVRFYKIIALSFLFLTIILLAFVVLITSKKATITVLAKEDTKSIDLSATVGPTPTSGTNLMGVVTSSDFSFSKKFQPTGSGQVEGTSGGKVTIYNNSATSQALVKTTRVLSSAGVLFRLTSAVTVPAHGQVEAEVAADQKGATGDIGPSDFTIPGLSADKQRMIYAKSTAPMTGGMHSVGVLSSEDISNAKNEYLSEIKLQYENKLPPAAPGRERIITAMSPALKVDHVVGDKVSEFTISGTSTMVQVEYSAADLKKLIDDDAQGKVDSSVEKLLSLGSKPTVKIRDFNLKTLSANIDIAEDVAVTLDADSEKLTADHFFGKKKEEIQRYIMTIDHVAGADVKFSPSWILSAPTVGDRIQVVVKNVE